MLHLFSEGNNSRRPEVFPAKMLSASGKTSGRHELPVAAPWPARLGTRTGSACHWPIYLRKKGNSFASVISFERDFMWNVARDPELYGYHI